MSQRRGRLRRWPTPLHQPRPSAAGPIGAGIALHDFPLPAEFPNDVPMTAQPLG
jgi:hypothetical protein